MQEAPTSITSIMFSGKEHKKDERRVPGGMVQFCITTCSTICYGFYFHYQLTSMNSNALIACPKETPTTFYPKTQSNMVCPLYPICQYPRIIPRPSSLLYSTSHSSSVLHLLLRLRRWYPSTSSWRATSPALGRPLLLRIHRHPSALMHQARLFNYVRAVL